MFSPCLCGGVLRFGTYWSRNFAWGFVMERLSVHTTKGCLARPLVHCVTNYVLCNDGGYSGLLRIGKTSQVQKRLANFSPEWIGRLGVLPDFPTATTNCFLPHCKRMFVRFIRCGSECDWIIVCTLRSAGDQPSVYTAFQPDRTVSSSPATRMWVTGTENAWPIQIDALYFSLESLNFICPLDFSHFPLSNSLPSLLCFRRSESTSSSLSLFFSS